MSGGLGRFFGLRIILVLVLGLLGACASVPPLMGVVSGNTNLKMSKIVVTDGVNKGRKFAHAMREELRYEFSRNSHSGKAAKLHMEIKSLSYRSGKGGMLSAGQNKMMSHIKLSDVTSDETIGNFDIVVIGQAGNANPTTKVGRAKIRTSMIKQTARQIVHKIFGYGRASRIEVQEASHKREPFRVPVIRPKLPKFPKFYDPISDQKLPKTAMGELPPAVIMEAKENPQKPAEPAIIKAPVLPVQ